MTALAELNFSLNHIKLDSKAMSDLSALPFKEKEYYDTYLLCKSFFDNNEYLRCAFFAEPFSKHCEVLRFLRFYALFLDCEKKRLEIVSDPKQMEHLSELSHEILASYSEGVDPRNYEPYDLYLLGMISRRLGDIDMATDYLVGALRKNPNIWGAWVELSFLIVDRKRLTIIEDMDSASKSWMYHFFCGHIFLELHMNEKALRTYFALQKAGFHKSTYIKSQIAIAYHNVQRVDEAIETFDTLSEEDPYRLDDMDLYSNMLYVKGEKYYLQVLANKAVEIDKYRVETSCIIGNLHSIKREHHKAIEYFERALRINPYYLSAWTLMGHEFMELKNSNAAIQCYREAVEVNRHDYRAWNGLGQTYDILKMPAYSLYYYKQAHNLRPNDSRLLTALGEAYEKLDRPRCAAKCYERAKQLGDIEGLAVLKLAKMQKLTDPDKAATAYLEYLQEMQANSVADRDEEGKAHLFLANYNFNKKDVDAAYKHAFKCLEYPEVKDEAKALLLKLASAKETEGDGEGDTTRNEGLDMDISTTDDATNSTATPGPAADTTEAS
ncbi:Cell division cycle protein 23 [Orchesella cincta]|uniref:Cell division cycle protein 23 n=1 Tax=Orchesella cincta TaxID=48709 RepID=A0A1D2ND46_ORCCI|nr:Cell division cycle protein 23 [Orchesella cincta]